MYSTRFENEQRYIVTCITNQTTVRVIETIVDSGAKHTCYRASFVDDALTEESLAGNPHIDIGGFIDGDQIKNTVRFYRFPVKQFTIGNIDLGARDIWVTFDKRVKDNVLGIDILQAVCLLQYDNEKELYFFKDRMELKSFVVSTVLA